MSEQHGARRHGQGGHGQASRGQRSRAVAIDVLVAVDREDAFANLLLPHRLREAGLSGADAALATELCYGALRMHGFYDRIIELVAGRTPEEIDPLALAALRIGAHQLLGLRVPSHAAVNETVAVVRARAGRGAAGFVNANLRAIDRESPEDWTRRVVEGIEDPDARAAVIESHPLWIVRAFEEALLGEGRGGELHAALAADNANPAVALAALPGRNTRDALLAEFPQRLTPLAAAPTAVELDHGDPHAFPAIRSGQARVQDAGSQLVALALAAARPWNPDEQVLDLCAGPGGKAALLAASMRAAGVPIGRFQANEVNPSRAKLVRDALRPLTGGRDEIQVTEHDGREVGAHPESFDRILVDAPCSGLGALRRRPEARWRKRPEDLPELVELQETLLDAALRAVRRGGIVAYVTCSPHPSETVAVVRRASRSREVEILDARSVCQELAPELDLPDRPLAGGTTVQLWPHRHGTDAMFLALLRRR